MHIHMYTAKTRHTSIPIPEYLWQDSRKKTKPTNIDEQESNLPAIYQVRFTPGKEMQRGGHLHEENIDRS